MPPLPFAPRPLAGEGLSSWVARLAVHNFVTPANFWTWLGCDDVHDLTLEDGLLDRLSGSTRLVVNELHRRFAPEPATKAAPLAVSWLALRNPRGGVPGLLPRRGAGRPRSLCLGFQRLSVAL